MATAESQVFSKTATVNADHARVDVLKEVLRSTPQEVDYERMKIMHDVYDETVGYQEIIRRATLIEAVVERKELYIDDNLFAGAIAENRQWCLSLSRMERGMDEGREDHREFEDSGIKGGQRMGARLLGQTFIEDPYGIDIRKAVWVFGNPIVRIRPRCQIP